MSVGIWQFGQGSLNPGSFALYRATSWPTDRFVHWHVRPAPGWSGVVALAGVAAEPAADGTLTYTLMVSNVGIVTVLPEVWYEERETWAINAPANNVPLPWDTLLASQNDPGGKDVGGDAELQALGVDRNQFDYLTLANAIQKSGLTAAEFVEVFVNGQTNNPAELDALLAAERDVLRASGFNV